jgi:hypothetical protein
MHRREKQVRQHWRPDEDEIRADSPLFVLRAQSPRSKLHLRPSMGWILPLAIPILSLILFALLLAGCEIGVALGLPRNDECRDVDTSPGDPISKECLDTIGKPAPIP